jgi:tetratricopeptide (TPR) repeat protein
MVGYPKGRRLKGYIRTTAKEMDAYVEARSYEREAREKEKRGEYRAVIELWKRYARIKERKGSYFLSIYGYCNVARICDKCELWEETAEFFVVASKLAAKIGEYSLWVLLITLACQMYEKMGNYDACTKCYEILGDFFDKVHNFFGSADAYEHAAEVMVLAGKDITGYEAPRKAWKKNYEYWKERGEMDDADWSLKRMSAYLALRTNKNAEISKHNVK